MLTFKIGNKVI